MSNLNNLLRASTVSTDTGGDETLASHLSQSTRSSDCSEGSSNDTSYTSTGSKSYTEGSYTEADELSVVETCTTYFEEDEDESTSASSVVESVDTSHSGVTRPERLGSNTLNSSKSTSSANPDTSPITPESPTETSTAEAEASHGQSDQQHFSQPDLQVGIRNDSNISASRFRVPGGAAAKLMLVGPKGSTEMEKDDDDINPIPSTESSKMNELQVGEKIDKEMQAAKKEFQKGTPPRRTFLSHHHERLHELQRSLKPDDISETSSMVVSSVPSFLNRKEIFHKTAAAAVEALLTPRCAPSIGNSDLYSVSSSGGPASIVRSAVPGGSDCGKKSFSDQQTQVQSPLSQNYLTEKAEKVLDEMKNSMLDPSATLTDLLTAIASPEEFLRDQLQTDLGYMVRRKNACGALQVLTTQQNNRIRICWTAGVLPALTSVIMDGMTFGSVEEGFPDRRIREEYSIARMRAIAALTNLSMPTRNRIAVFHTPDLIQSLIYLIDNDKDGAARRSSCALFALLAKSADNRILMFHIPGLLEAVRKLIHPRPPRVEPVKEERIKKHYPWMEEDDDDNNSDSNQSNFSKQSGEATDGVNPKRHEERQKSLSSGSGASHKSNGRDDCSDDGESGETPKVKGSKTSRELCGYDETVDEFLRGSRQNLFALLGHLVKEKDNAYYMARETDLLESLVSISKFKESSSHTFAVKILANLTRHRLNKHLAFKPKSFIPALIEATQSPSDDARLYAIYALQNLSQEKSCRQELAIAHNLLVVLCDRCRNGKQDQERLAAISTLKNLCDEPANLIPMTNTPGCVSILMHFAHGGVNDAAERPVTEMMQYRACDALATLSHWLRKISTSGYALEVSNSQGNGQQVLAKGQLFVPSLREVSWNQWQ